MGRLGPLLTSQEPVFEATVCQVLRVQAVLVQCHVQSVESAVSNLWILQKYQMNSTDRLGPLC